MLIGEVARRTGVSARMLRHYDALGLVMPTGRTTGGYREYSADDIRRLFHVESLRTLGLSLTEAGRALDDPGFAPAELVSDLISATRTRIAAETELLTRLERVDATGPAQWGDVLRVVALLRALESDATGRRQQAVLTQDDEASLPVGTLAAAALSEDNVNVAGALRWSLARAGNAGLAELAAGLESADVDVRHRAIVAIAAVPTGEAAALLSGGLADDEVTVRDRAALALASRRDVDAMPVLLDMVVGGRSDIEAAEMLGLLAEQPDVAADIVGVVRHLLAAATAPARSRLTQALAEIPGPGARDLLVALTDDGDRTVAATASVILRVRERGDRRSRRLTVPGDPGRADR